MKKKIIIISAITVLCIATGSVMANSMFKKGQITCPECGSEITLEMPDKKPDFKDELDKKVQNGEITQQEADEKLAEFENSMPKKDDIRKMPNKSFEEELAKKVENGEITQEKADEILLEFEENMKNRPQRQGRFGNHKPLDKPEDIQE